MTAKILQFPGVIEIREPVEVEVADEDFADVRAAIEQEVEQAATDLGQCATEEEWVAEVNTLVERLLQAALRKAPSG